MSTSYKLFFCTDKILGTEKPSYCKVGKWAVPKDSIRAVVFMVLVICGAVMLSNVREEGSRSAHHFSISHNHPVCIL